MMTNDDRRYEPNALFVVVPLVIILIPLVYSVGAWAVSLAAPAEPFLEMPDAQFEECVRETEYMRFSHMTLLQTSRDQAIRLGNRGDIGLSRLKAAASPVLLGDGIELTYCSDCHTSREQFCNQCHTAVNLNLDCFSCHEYE